MADDAKLNKAQKLAAARKKLKEYQMRNSDAGGISSVEGGSVSSNVSEKSDIDCIASEHEIVSGDNSIATFVPSSAQENIQTTSNGPALDLNTIQILITEKTQLMQDVNKYSIQCREKEMELEELRIQLHNSLQRNKDLQQQFLTQQQSAEQLRRNNAELQHKLAQARAENEDQVAHIKELQEHLNSAEERLKEEPKQLKIVSDKLEMAEIRIQQLSDESGLSTDNRIETMMQTQLMYEQQIRDLQAMVQQMTEEKEQSHVQYQTYVQQLNMEMGKLNERHTELQQQNERLQQREEQLVQHVSHLERDIQKNLNRQQKLQTEAQNQNNSATDEAAVAELREQISELEFERHEFVLKIKSQEDRLQLLNAGLQQSQSEVETLRDRLEAISSEQPEQNKLLAIMESDKVAASRALAQNVEMKKQLDELELRFVQLTNDKADLRNRLDAEEYTNRDMRNSYEAMEQRLRSMDERFKFKDEEMIRLAHENTELTKQLALMQQKMQQNHNDSLFNGSTKSNHDHNHNAHNDFEGGIEATEATNDSKEHNYQQEQHDHHNHHHEDEHCHEHDHHTHGHEHDHHKHEHEHDDIQDHCAEAKNNEFAESQSSNAVTSKPIDEIYTAAAMEKLQKRFTNLISQVADLTDEKQRLEHLVLQLQGETETIGEYITLYQTQRRMLKQREYEKAAQMELLQAEREQLHEKIKMLNDLVNSLGMKVPTALSSNDIATTVNELFPQQTLQALGNKSAPDSQVILDKIQNIITEIEQNTKEPVVDTVGHTADHLTCCLGKFEVV